MTTLQKAAVCLKVSRLKKITVACCGLLLILGSARSDDFKTTNGKEYKNATVTLVEPDGITLRSKSGVSKVYFNELPKEVQERFHYDPQKAAAASAGQAASIQQTNQQIEEANKQREKEKQVAVESSRRATEQAAKAQNTTIEPGNKTATGRHVVGVGGVNGLEVEMSEKELQLEKAAREETMSPEEKQWRYARDLKTYEGAKQAAARRGLDSNKIVPPRQGQLDYAPFANLVR
jgi:hypothetical protein